MRWRARSSSRAAIRARSASRSARARRAARPLSPSPMSWLTGSVSVGQVATEPVGERGGVLRDGADHDRQLALVSHEAGQLVDQVAVVGQRARGRPTSRQGGCCSKIAIALRAETVARVSFWANSKNVWIG